ncbi:MAG: SMC-Scp complex subunit ScpB [Pseudomonadota bacterium]
MPESSPALTDQPANFQLTPSNETPEDQAQLKLILETVLLSAEQALTLAELKKIFDHEISNDRLRTLLAELRQDWCSKGLELSQLASGWRFRTRAEYQPYLERIKSEKAPKYSRAVLETLAIIVYHQPVTRGDIEEIRGVSVAAPLLRTLEERGWIDVVGQRETPGRPELLATTKKFLDDLGLNSLSELPPLEKLNPTPEAGNAQ